MSKSTRQIVYLAPQPGRIRTIHLQCTISNPDPRRRTNTKPERKMTAPDFTTTIVVEQTPKEAFDAITNVRGWWSEEIEGNTSKLHDEFAYHYEDMHRCKMKLIEVIPDSKIVWLVMENYFDFTKDKSEWTGTTIRFEISKPDGKPDSNKTQIRFTHVGLVPEYECYDVCKEGWSNYINKSLRNLITKGKGQPNATGKPRTASEEKLKTDRK